MPSFVESATLKLNQQEARKVVTGVRKINAELRKLDTTAKALKRTLASLDLDKVFRQPARSQGITRAVGDLKQLNAQLSKLRAQANRPFTVNVNQRTSTANPAGVPIIPVAPRTQPSPTQPTRRSRAGFLGNSPIGIFSDVNRFPAIAGRTLSFAVTGELYMTARNVVIAGAISPFDRESAVRRLELAGVTPEERSVVEQVAEQIAREIAGVPATALISESPEALGRITAPLTSEEGRAQVEDFLRRMAETVAILRAYRPDLTAEQAAEQARQLDKALVLSRGFQDPERREDITQALRQALIATGGDISGTELKRALQQVASLGGGIGEDTLLQVLLNRDEAGRRGTGEFRQAFEDMIRSNLNASDFEAQVSAGLRDETGKSTIATAFQENMLDVIENEFIPRLEKLGVDIGDRVAVMQALDEELGFSKQGGINTLANLITFLSEARDEFERAQGTTPEAAFENQSTREQFAELVANFQDLTAQVFDPLVPVVNSGIESLANFFERIQEGGADLQDFAVATGGAIGGAVVLGKAIKGIASFATAGPQLNIAARELQIAAARLSTAAGVDAAGDVGRGGKKGGRLLPAIPPAVAALPLIVGGASRTQPGDYRGMTADERADWHREVRAQLEPSEFEKRIKKVSQIELPKEEGRVIANVIGDEMIMQADDWGKSAGAELMRVSEENAETIRQAITDAATIAATILADGVISGASNAQFRWPGAPRSGVSTSADLGYSGPGEGGGAAATSAIGLF